MKSFEFRLERVLRWRSAQLTAEEAKLRRLVEEQAGIQRQIHHLRAEKLKIETSAAGLGSLEGHDLASLHGYHLHSISEERRLLDLHGRKEQAIAAQQRSYREAKRRFHLLEELRSRKLTAWRQEWDKEIDQVAAESFLAVRQRAQAGDESG